MKILNSVLQLICRSPAKKTEANGVRKNKKGPKT